MRLDTAILEELMARARLSTREREAMRLDCSASYTLEELAGILGCGVNSAKTLRNRGRRKFRLVQAAYEAEQRGREVEDLDEEDLGTPRGLARFLLGAVEPPHYSDHGPNIGLTWTEYDLKLKIESTMAQEGAVHAGPMVTVDDLLRCSRTRPIGPNPYGRDTD